MIIDILTVPDCPNTRNAVSLVTSVLMAASVNADIRVLEVPNAVEARRIGLPGSPTIRVDGVDVVQPAAPYPGFYGCRVYTAGEQLSGCPPRESVEDAILGTKDGPPSHILYVCVHNAGRSQMAEAMTNALAAKFNLPTTAESAGTAAEGLINPIAASVMEELGVSMTGKSPKQLTHGMIARAGRVITMGCGVDADACPAGFTVTEDWGLDDPKGRPIKDVRAIRDEIRRRIEYMLGLSPGVGPIAVSKL